MRYIASKQIFAAGMALSMLAYSLPTLAATTVISSFGFARDTAVADGVQYFAISYDVASPGTNIQLNNGAQDYDIAYALPGTMQQSGNMKVNAVNAMFPIDPAIGGNVINMTLKSNGKSSVVKPLYVYKAIKPNTDINLALSAGANADAGETLIIKQGAVAGQTITPTFSYDTTGFFGNPIDSFLVAGGKEIQVTSGVATTVNALPVGTYNAYFRGYNYAKTDKTKKFGASGKPAIKLIVLGKPALTRVSVDRAPYKDGITPKSCISSGYGVGRDKIVMKWDATNVTGLKITIGTQVFEIKGGNGVGKIYNLDADCLTGSGTLNIVPKNTDEYVVAPYSSTGYAITVR